jgi:phosphopantothenoylcysteine decarboxylase/phosphopantothenate--cysteine ligase
MQRKKKIVLAVCGSVAAIEAPKIARELSRNGIDVECVMTKSARRIIHPYVLHWASGKKVITRLTGDVEHVRLCGINGEACLLLICPATANTISKIANGIDDTTVTTFASTALGSGIPVVVVPAMHESIYRNPFVSENIEKLKKNGVKFIEPRFEENKAKLADSEKVMKEVLRLLK